MDYLWVVYPIMTAIYLLATETRINKSKKGNDLNGRNEATYK